MWSAIFVLTIAGIASIGAINFPIRCDPNYRFRSINGSCNNLQNPHWAMSKTPYARLLPNNYGDRKYALPVSVTGAPLPSARHVSNVLNPVGSQNDYRHTLGLMQFGQIVAHDLSFTGFGEDFGKPAVECCVDGQFGSDVNNPRCAVIHTPPNDPIFGPAGYRCLNLERTVTSRDVGWTPASEVAEPITVVTGHFDLSNVYGPTDDVARRIRLFRGGRLITEQRHGQSWIQNARNSTETCGSANANHVPCYDGGDVRINQNPQLTILQTTFVREHNRLADGLAAINPHWNDERLYQEARQINIAKYQKIVYTEYVPRIIGEEYARRIGAIHAPQYACTKDYDGAVDASAVVESASAALRALHSQIAGSLNFINEHREAIGSIRITDHININDVLEQRSPAGNTCDLKFDLLTRGMGYQPTKYNDKYFVGQMKHYLFKGNRTLGTDLRAIDIQRERDHGVGTYLEALSYCAMPIPSTFDDLRGRMPDQDIAALRQVYADVRDISLNSGGLLEYPAPNALVSQTYACMLGAEFRRARTGDRFFYENCNVFNQAQLNSIRQGSFACHMCRNAYCVTRMQPQAFDTVGFNNQLEDCQRLCPFDLSPWREARE